MKTVNIKEIILFVSCVKIVKKLENRILRWICFLQKPYSILSRGISINLISLINAGRKHVNSTFCHSILGSHRNHLKTHVCFGRTILQIR